MKTIPESLHIFEVLYPNQICAYKSPACHAQHNLILSLKKHAETAFKKEQEHSVWMNSNIHLFESVFSALLSFVFSSSFISKVGQMVKKETF